MKYAVIDIGSNSVRLMLWADGTTLYKRVFTTRLGEGMVSCLTESAMKRTAEAVRLCCAEGKDAGAEVLSFATAAVRNAQNGASFCDEIERECGVRPEVISGEDEASLAVLGALGQKDGAILDIGGASTEYCVRKGGRTIFSESLPVGCVRLYDACGEDEGKLRSFINDLLNRHPLPAPEGTLWAVGGTASTLACVLLGLSVYDPSRVQGCELSLDKIEKQAKSMLSMTASERKLITGMDPARADIIAGGALLLYSILKHCKAEKAYFSDRDNLEGYLAFKGLI